MLNNKYSFKTCFNNVIFNIYFLGCFQGFWGENCSRTCSPTCIDQHCYPENGSCVLGCDPQNCLNHKCDIYTGTCTDGCVSGLSGQHCNTCEYILKFS